MCIKSCWGRTTVKMFELFVHVTNVKTICFWHSPSWDVDYQASSGIKTSPKGLGDLGAWWLPHAIPRWFQNDSSGATSTAFLGFIWGSTEHSQTFPRECKHVMCTDQHVWVCLRSWHQGISMPMNKVMLLLDSWLHGAAQKKQSRLGAPNPNALKENPFWWGKIWHRFKFITTAFQCWFVWDLQYFLSLIHQRFIS